MQKVLFVSYDFPPRRTSGVYRAVGFCRYLANHGWQPTVLTIQSNPDDIEDKGLLARVPSTVCIDRTYFFSLSAWENRTAATLGASQGLKSKAGSDSEPLHHKVLRRMGDFVRSCLYFPDDTVGWVPFGIRRALKLLRRESYDVVYTTSPPRATPLIGLFVKIFCRVPWVAEFRDPWYPSPRPIRRRAERVLLRFILRRADHVVVISDGHAEYLRKEFRIPAEKVSVVSNGFEETEFNAPDGRTCDFLSAGNFHFSHFGTVYPGYSGCFFEALRQWLQECPEARNTVRVNVIGFPDEIVHQAAETAELQGLVRVFGFVPHDIAIDAMRKSDVLLVFLGNSNVARLSGLGKIFDYFRAGKPVLAVSYDGGTAQLVKKSGAGWVVNPEDARGIKDALNSALQRSKSMSLPAPNPDFVRQFRYDHLAGKLANIFDRVLRNGR